MNQQQRSFPSVTYGLDARSSESGPDSRLQDGFIKPQLWQMLLILPASMPDSRDRNHIQRKVELVQNSNLTAKLHMSDSKEEPAFLSMGATSKLFMQQGITTAVEYLSRTHEGLTMIEGPLLLVQVPAISRENFVIRENPVKVDDHRRMEVAAIPPKQTEVWRYCLDPIGFDKVTEKMSLLSPENDLIDLRDNAPKELNQKSAKKTSESKPKPEPKEKRSEVQEQEFNTYVAKFEDHLKAVVTRLGSEPDEMHMRINLGALFNLQVSSKLKKNSLRDYERMLSKVMNRGNFYFSKDISYLTGDALSIARKVRLAIEASPEQFSPASNRIDLLEEVPLETTVVVFTRALRFDMQLQGFIGRKNRKQEKLELVRPSIFKRELKNREKYIISANPGGAFDWDLEVLVRESQDKLNDSLRQIHRFMDIKTEEDGTFRPFFTNKQVQNTVDVTLISTKSARTYEMGRYNVELAVYIDWDPQSGKRLWQSCAISLYSNEWNEVLERQNLAFSPRDFGACNSALLSVGPDDRPEDGAKILLDTVERLQKFLSDLVLEPGNVEEFEGVNDKKSNDVQAVTGNEDPADIAVTQVQRIAKKVVKSLRVTNAKDEIKTVPTASVKAQGKPYARRRASRG